MGGADAACLQSGRSWHGDPLIHECLVNAAAKLAEGFGQHNRAWRGLDLRVSEATGRHDSKVRAPAMAALLIGGAQVMRESLQSAQDADGHGPSTTRGCFRKPLVETLRDGADERRPGTGVSPLPEGRHDRDKVRDL
jgi:hypothetical protein